jgi:hypothetical protein
MPSSSSNLRIPASKSSDSWVTLSRCAGSDLCDGEFVYSPSGVGVCDVEEKAGGGSMVRVLFDAIWTPSSDCEKLWRGEESSPQEVFCDVASVDVSSLGGKCCCETASLESGLSWGTARVRLRARWRLPSINGRSETSTWRGS